MAVGADDVLERAQVVGTMTQALSGTLLAVALTARRRELATPALWARDAAAELAQAAIQGEVAMVFGNETSGLSNEELGLCGRWATIPADPGFSSLNLAAAVQLMCYELRLAAGDPGAPPPILGAGEPASHDEVEGLVAHLERAAVDCGFLDPQKPRRLIPRLRRLLARAGPEKEEVNILRGLLAALEEPLPGASAEFLARRNGKNKT
jgi:tRNA/rRNA methyltransferase